MKSDDLLDLLGNADDNMVAAARNPGKRKKNTWVKWGAIAACLCLVVIGAIKIIPRNVTDGATAIEGSGKKHEPAGPNEGIMYSVAVLPADGNLDDVQNAYCEEIYQEEAQNEAGLCDYLPADLPDGYHFGHASIYVTTMKDSTVYKMLRITYITGEAPEISVDEDGEKFARSPVDSGNEFRVSVFSFKPDTSCGIYTPEEIRGELIKGNLGNGLFYVRYGNYYVGIDPLSLSTDEIIGLIDSIGR